MGLTFRKLKKMLQEDGWYEVRQTGSHIHYRHFYKKGTVTVAGKDSDEPKPKTLKSIFIQAGWDVKD